MKTIIYILFIVALSSCTSSKKMISDKSVATTKSDTVRIANDSLEYEVIIIDAGFSSWMNGRSKPRGFYGIDYLEGRNQIYVTEWNNRVLQPQRYEPMLYEMQINYDRNIRYGYEVNYLIYNYFIYFQITNRQQLAGFVPRQ
jgi:Family of unknown function (DUF6146)